MGFAPEPISRRKTYELVAERLVAMIATHALGPGDQLPTERELTESFKVGRSSVREALRMLESQGVITGGGGSFVVAAAANPLNSSLQLLLSLDGDTQVRHVFELREILECEAAALAAARHAPEHLAQMDEAVEAMAASLRSPEGDGFIDADLRFHLALAAATENRLVLHAMHAVREVIRRALLTVYHIPSSPESAIDEHRAIREAVASGDAERAREAMRTHLVRVESDVQKGASNG